MKGWVSLHRKILDNPIVCKDSDYFSVWCYLLLNATHDQYDVEFKGKRVTLKPGQLITGRKSIADKFKINESKVQRILKKLEIEQQIEQQTSSKNRLITVVRWTEYQESNNKTTTSEQQVNTNNNGNNGNKKRYMDYVLLNDTEYSKLIEKLGKQKTSQAIDNLNNYIGSKGKKYKSHYHTILSWERKNNKEEPQGVQTQAKPRFYT